MREKKKEIEQQERNIIIWIIQTKSFSCAILKAISILLSISITNLGLVAFFSRDSLPRIKHHVYVINLDDKQNKRMHWASLFIRRNTVV